MKVGRGAYKRSVSVNIRIRNGIPYQMKGWNFMRSFTFTFAFAFHQKHIFELSLVIIQTNLRTCSSAKAIKYRMWFTQQASYSFVCLPRVCSTFDVHFYLESRHFIQQSESTTGGKSRNLALSRSRNSTPPHPTPSTEYRLARSPPCSVQRMSALFPGVQRQGHGAAPPLAIHLYNVLLHLALGQLRLSRVLWFQVIYQQPNPGIKYE
jgi:hypothetical protein